MLKELFIEFFVRDLATHLLIFRDVLGLKVTKEGGDVITLEHKSVQVLLHHSDEVPVGHFFDGVLTDKHRDIGVETCFSTSEIDTLYQRAKRANLSTTDLMKQDWALRDFRIMTSDGYYLRITEPRSALNYSSVP